MAVRIRKNGTILCAAKSPELEGDMYINDGLHYCLSSELLVLSVCGKDKDGAEIWEFHKPLKSMSERIEKEERALSD